VGREKGKAEIEVWAREDGEGFDEDVGRGFVARKVRVELVSSDCTRQLGSCKAYTCSCIDESAVQIELICSDFNQIA
jgi:hypothetical protein